MSSRCDGGWPPFPEPTSKPKTVREALSEAEVPHDQKPSVATPLRAERWSQTARGSNHAERFSLNRLAWDKPAPAICRTSGTGGHMHPDEPRLLTIGELRRLASFGDSFKFAGAWTDAADRIGNSVPPKFAQAIATCIREHILGDREFTYISTFAGCGGSSLGYKWAGGHGLAAVEFDANAVETYRLNFPDTPVLQRDIATVTAEELLALTGLQVGELDILDGSPPCQGFSTAGKRQFSDPRNSLFKEYVRLIEGLQPKVFVMENVSGMVKGKMKLVFREIMLALKGTGYTVRCKLLNAMYYEVPQSRERLIWIGVRGDIGNEPGFPEPVGKPISAGEAIGQLDAVLSDGYAGNAFDGGKPAPTLRKGRPLDIRTRSQRIKPWMNGPAACICKTAAGYELQEGGKLRRVTIDEAKALCTFPQEWRLTGNYAEQWARLGNAVMPRFMYHIAAHIRDHVLPAPEGA